MFRIIFEGLTYKEKVLLKNVQGIILRASDFVSMKRMVLMI